MNTTLTAATTQINTELKDIFQPVLAHHESVFPGSKNGFKSMAAFPETLWIVTAIFDSSLHGCTIHNDPFYTVFRVEDLANGEYELTVADGLSLLVQPFDHEKHLAYSCVKMPFRKVKGSAEKIITKIKQIQKQQFELVKTHKDRIKNIQVSNLKDVV